MAVQPDPACLRISRCELRVSDWQWPYANDQHAAIEANWERRKQELPGLFNGAVYLLRDHTLEAGALTGTLLRTDFKTLLLYRGLDGVSADGVREVFGCAIIRSADGHILLGRQRAGQVNSGRVYPPGGLIDDDDVRDAAVDINASIARELGEETGLRADEMQRVPGYTVARVGRKVAIAAEWRSALPADALRAQILHFLHSQAEPELEDIVIVRNLADLAAIGEARIPPHSMALLRTLLSA